MICYVNLRTRCWVYNTYLSHQNMCFVLILKYPHTWTLKIHSIHPGPHWNMKMGDIAVSGRNILATDQMLWTVIKEKIWSPIKNILDRCPNKYNVTDRGKSWAGDRIFWGGSSSGPKPQSWSHRGYPERERMSDQGRCQNVIISILESCDSIPILSRIKPSMTLRGSQREFHSRQNVIIPIIRWLYLIIPI